MALPHALSGEVVDVQPYGTHIEAAQSVALFKAGQLEVMRLVLQVGQRMPSHHVVGEITLHCLEGSVQVEVGGEHHCLPAGHLMYVAGSVPHALEAPQQASSVLVTIAL